MSEENREAPKTDERSTNVDPLLLNHEYDGIQEYDNPMPTWWRWIFWLSFYYGVGYFIHYHVTDNGESTIAAYEAEVALAREKEASELIGGELNEETLGKLMNNGEVMKDAKKLFILRCAQCHGNSGEGKIGPNLTDSSWLHGDASLTSILEVVSDGVQSKGMPPWKRQLRPIELGKVTAFIGSIRNTNLPGPRGPEGKKVGAE